MSNVKEGDIAKIVGEPGCHNALVEVIQKSSGEYPMLVWVCQALSCFPGYEHDWTGDAARVDCTPGDLVEIPDTNLRPLPPLADDTTDETHTNKEAETL